MASGAGVIPAAGLAESQLPPEVAAVNATADPSLVVTLTFCGEAVPLTVALKLSADELSWSVGTAGGTGVTTLTVTGTDCGLLLALVEAIDTLPWKVPTGRPAATMPTVTPSGVLPPDGIAVSQFPPEVVEALVVNAIGEPPLVTCTACVGGLAPLIVKVSDEGLTESVGGGGGPPAGVRT